VVKILQTDKRAFTFARQTDGRTKPDGLLKMQNELKQGQTVQQICLSVGMKLEAFRKRWERANPDKIGRTFKEMGGRYGTPTKTELDIVLSGFSVGAAKTDVVQYGVTPSEILADKKRSESKKRTDEKPAETAKEVEPEVVKNKPFDFENAIVFVASLMVTLCSMGLTTFGLWTFAGFAGLILGAMFAAYLAASVAVARNKNKGDTSESALSTVSWIEAGASVLHTFTFAHWIKYQTGLNEWYLWAFSAICAAFAAYISYRAVLTIRQYNAETIEETPKIE